MDYFIGLGSNLGDRLATLQTAIERLAAIGTIVDCSSVWETPPMYLTDQPPFLNAVALVRSSLDPDALMSRLLAIETLLGRVRSERFGPRTLDLDIVAAADVSYTSSQVRIPHPRLEERAFVVVPMLEIAPDWRNPATGRTLSSLTVAHASLLRFAPPLLTMSHP